MLPVRPVPLQLVIVLSVSLALFASLALRFLFPELHWRQEHLHSAMEAIGGLSAIVMAIVLFQRNSQQRDRRSEALAIGFLAMGTLEECHAISHPGNGFILLRSLASFFGGVGFALVWLAEPHDCRPKKPWLPWGIAVGSMSLGLAILGFPEHVPEMLRNGEFAPTAVAPTSLACLLFLSAALRFYLDYRHAGKSDAYLFACLALLFGLAELMFTYSLLWDARWWFWHVLRLLAYLLVLGYMVIGYQRMVSDLRVSLAQTRTAEESVRRSELHLRQALEDRERIAQDLHDGIIQSLFALGLSLERCQRLVTNDPEEVIRQLGLSVAELKTVIRDLRGYIVGLEPHIADGHELEASLALQASMLKSSPDLHFTLQIDPEAAQLVASEQATHLLYIAREAMSNALRHSKARHASLSLALHDGRVRLVTQDDGIGFNMQALQGGEGLKNMAARAAKLHARLTVASEAGQG
ncbi:MAG: hypothetical protein C4293_11595, partial [Nitrospiraceae bacterium]